MQNVIALSATEAKMIFVIEAAKETLYLKQLLCDLGVIMHDNVMVNRNSHSGIHLVENLTFNSRIKHIETRESFLVVMNEEKLVGLQKIHKKDSKHIY